ncbi:MAG: alpha/beta hydrolase-fold protein [Planctomycetota bacterium]|nr:alpha/beta hydrolase-fold protein [Planctomycetota bacterium]
MIQFRTVLLVLGCMLTCVALGADSRIDVKGPETRDDGIINYTVMSPYQKRPTIIEVLLPDGAPEGARYPVLYILPVNDGLDGQWGSGIQEAKRHSIHNRYKVICVSPEYDYTPWFGDHPTDPTLGQESYLLKVVIPVVEGRFPVVKGKDGRLLLGFSKSGFGAITIFMRHLDVIGKAVAWDSPLTMKSIFPEEEEMKVVFENQENFDKYCIPNLVKLHAATLKSGSPRLFLVSNANPNDSITALHSLFDTCEIPHHYQIDERRKHDWRSGWFPVVADLLFTPEAGGMKRPGKRNKLF